MLSSAKRSGVVLVLTVFVASFIGVFSAFRFSPVQVVSYTVTQPYLSTITQTVTVLATATAYVTKTEIQGYPQYVTQTQYITITTTSQSSPGYGGIATLTFLHFSLNNSLQLEARAISSQGIGMSIGFHCEPRVSDYIPYTYRATLSVPSGQSYWIIVRNLSLSVNVPIQVQDITNPWLTTATVVTPFFMYISGSCQFRVP